MTHIDCRKAAHWIAVPVPKGLVLWRGRLGRIELTGWGQRLTYCLDTLRSWRRTQLAVFSDSNPLHSLRPHGTAREMGSIGERKGGG